MTKSQLRQQHHLSEAVEDYLKAIYHLREAALISGETTPHVTTTALATHVGVAPSSVTGMIKKLADHHLVDHTPYHGVTLTPAGEHIALELVRHHRLIELYLTHIIGFGWDEVHDQADVLEHAISEEFEDRIADLLGDPTQDPHGDPIPTKDGRLLSTVTSPLVALPPTPEQLLVITRVLTQDVARLRYLAELGLVPGTTLTLVRREPFGGPLCLRHYDDNGTARECQISEELARLLFVQPAHPAAHAAVAPV